MSQDIDPSEVENSVAKVANQSGSEIRGFGSIAIQLAKNPLGIIALFIVLVYAIAGTVVSIEKPESIESNMGMGFVVVFPFVVLLAFYRLVTHHHPKLYDPSQIVQHDKFVNAWTMEYGRFNKAIPPEIEQANKNAISKLEGTGLSSADIPTMKSALYIGEWTSRRMAADRAIFRQIRDRGLDGFRQAESNPKLYDAVSRVFDFLEELSEDLNSNSVDRQIIYDAMGGSMRRAWERTAEFIIWERAAKTNPNFMSSLEKAYKDYMEARAQKKQEE